MCFDGLRVFGFILLHSRGLFSRGLVLGHRFAGFGVLWVSVRGLGCSSVLFRSLVCPV